MADTSVAEVDMHPDLTPATEMLAQVVADIRTALHFPG
jgi:hypothetical protein